VTAWSASSAAELRLVPDSHTFIPEDQPAALGELIIEFAGSDRAA
jgi:hypothetical protein